MNVLDQYLSPHAALYHGDTCEIIKGLPDASIDFSVFSPPFEGLYVYSASDRDMGNSHGSAQFAEHLRFLAREMFRIMKPGRIVALHCMDLPTSIEHDGYIGFRDFPARLREVYEEAGFIYHCPKITIWKDPEVQANRTYARQLTHHLMCDDSSMSGIGTPDYILLMRKPGKSEVPVTHKGDALATKNDANKPEHWQRWASPIWAMPHRDPFEDGMRTLLGAIASGDTEDAATMAAHLAATRETLPPFPDFCWATANGTWRDGFVDYEDPRGGNTDKRGIDQGDTLNVDRATKHTEKDERHICPLQRGVVHRLIDLYTNPGEIVYTPFLGIGTEAACAVERGRKGVGCELKGAYFKQAVEHVKRVEPGAAGQQTSLLDLLRTPKCADCNESGSVGDCAICGGKVS